MVRTQSQTVVGTASTVIGPEIRVLGRVTGEEDLHVQGRIDGAIALTETLYVAAGGIVAAEVDALNVVVSGVLVGNVTARDCVTLHAGAKLVGDITAPRLIIADGAAFKGSVHMGGESDEANAARSAVRSRPAPPRRVATPERAPLPPRRATPVRVEPPRASKPAPPPPADSSVDDGESTVVVRHRALAENADGSDGRPKDAPEVARFRGVAATRAPARASEDAPAATKGKLPARARIPKPGKRRVNRR
jgi:cytoskeletal protein CcmA (bactofilin family)